MKDEMDPELLDEETHRLEQEDPDEEIPDDEISRMEQEEPPRPHPGLIYQPIRPVVKEGDYKDLGDCFLLPEHGPHDIQPNTVYFDPDHKQIKFLLLKKVLAAPYIRAKLALEGARWFQSDRGAADSQPRAKKITWGFFPQTPGHIAGHGYYSVRSKPTLEQPALAYDLRPLVKAMDACLREYLPTYYPKALQHALHAEQRNDVLEDDWSRIPKTRLPEHEAYDAKVKAEAVDGPDESRIDRPVDYRPNPVGLVKGIDGPWPGHIYTLWGTVFSTLELNSNIVFKAHEDSHNIKGDLICISALGNWVGGRLIFPRYGYGADLEPTDLLICDNANELHGNVGPLIGERNKGRFSVVAYMHSNVLDYANQEGPWRPRSSPNQAR
jgi:hypothetical protein